jgi:hypothetical protein
MSRLVLLLALTAAVALPASASAGTTYNLQIAGAEVPPITSTLGTFVGAAHGDLVGAWRISVEHQPLRSGPSVAVTGGGFSLLLKDGHRVVSAVLGGSVTVSKPGAGCTNQVYAVRVRLEAGSFTGTLTHRRHAIFGRCLIYAATITGTASLAT